MYGFHRSNGSRRSQDYADGGLVDSIVGGAKRIAHLVSLGHGDKTASPPPPQPAQPQAPAQKPAEPKAITGYAGMDARRKQMEELGLKDGGPVLGPGTGVSDSIKTKVPEGTYIMPADSTEQAGLGFKPKDIPVNLSNGEFKLSPKQVQQIGISVLDAVKNATHTPASMQRGAMIDDASPGEDEGTVGDMAEDMQEGNGKGANQGNGMFFADGGIVDERARRQAMQQGQGQSGFIARAFPNTAAAARGVSEDVQNAYQTGGVGAAVGQGARSAMVPAWGAADDVMTGVKTVLDPAAQALKTFVTGDPTPIGQAPSAQAPASSTTQAKTPSASTAATPVQAGAPATYSNEGRAATALQADNEITASSGMPNNIVRRGNSFSGTDIGPGYTVNGKEAGGNLSIVPSGASGRFPDGQAYPIGAQIVYGTGQQEGPKGLGILNPRGNSDRNSVLGAAMTPLRGSPNGQLTANQLRVAQGIVDGDQRDATTRYTSDQSAATQRDVSQMNNDSAMARTGIGEAGANQRAAASTGIQQGDLHLRREAQGFKSRELQRQESLYAKYDAAKTPDERSAIAQQIRDLSGRETPNRFTAVQGGQEIDPLTQQLVTRPGRIFNNQTGQFVDQQQSAPASAQRQVGTRSTVNGKTAVWDGKKWVPQ